MAFAFVSLVITNYLIKNDKTFTVCIQFQPAILLNQKIVSNILIMRGEGVVLGAGTFMWFWDRGNKKKKTTRISLDY